MSAHSFSATILAEFRLCRLSENCALENCAGPGLQRSAEFSLQFCPSSFEDMQGRTSAEHHSPEDLRGWRSLMIHAVESLQGCRKVRIYNLKISADMRKQDLCRSLVSLFGKALVGSPDLHAH